MTEDALFDRIAEILLTASDEGLSHDQQLASLEMHRDILLDAISDDDDTYADATR